MIFREDKGTGYMYCYSPLHYCANNAGKVMEHVMVMADFIGRKLYSNECVHHIDRNKKNNHITNLMLLTLSEHAELHRIEDDGYCSERIEKACPVCGSKMFLTKSGEHRVNCSVKCSSEASKRFEISKEDLQEMVWKYPTSKVAKILGVSDVAVAKRCKLFGISKPPRGYWRKVQTGKI